MFSFFMTAYRFVAGLLRSISDPEFRGIFVVLLTLIFSGTIFYTTVEGWSMLDSFYFCVMTLSTIGYGDLSPTTDLSKLFTVFYVFVGLGVFAAFIAKLTASEHQKHWSKHNHQQDSGLKG
jgi:hypothetical protein